MVILWLMLPIAIAIVGFVSLFAFLFREKAVPVPDPAPKPSETERKLAELIAAQKVKTAKKKIAEAEKKVAEAKRQVSAAKLAIPKPDAHVSENERKFAAAKLEFAEAKLEIAEANLEVAEAKKEKVAEAKKTLEEVTKKFVEAKTALQEENLKKIENFETAYYPDLLDNSGYRNNCGSNALAHALMDACVNQCIDLNSAPYSRIVSTFNRFYRTNYTAEQLLVIYKRVNNNHYSDVDFIFGPIFRKHIADTLISNKEYRKDIKDVGEDFFDGEFLGEYKRYNTITENFDIDKSINCYFKSIADNNDYFNVEELRRYLKIMNCSFHYYNDLHVKNDFYTYESSTPGAPVVALYNQNSNHWVLYASKVLTQDIVALRQQQIAARKGVFSDIVEECSAKPYSYNLTRDKQKVKAHLATISLLSAPADVPEQAIIPHARCCS